MRALLLLLVCGAYVVVVFTGGNYVGASPEDEIVTRYILPAMR